MHGYKGNILVRPTVHRHNQLQLVGAHPQVSWQIQLKGMVTSVMVGYHLLAILVQIPLIACSLHLGSRNIQGVGGVYVIFALQHILLVIAQIPKQAVPIIMDSKAGIILLYHVIYIPFAACQKQVQDHHYGNKFSNSFQNIPPIVMVTELFLDHSKTTQNFLLRSEYGDGIQTSYLYLTGLK